jgi:citrate lyase subunit gamma (acyl carrier protein)
MKITQRALAGTVESSDCMVMLLPAEELSIEIDSIVKQQYGHVIEKLVRDMLKKFDVTAGLVKIQDQGALDCVIEARVETALRRAGKEAKA